MGKLELRKKKGGQPQGGEAQLKKTRRNQAMIPPKEMSTGTAKVGDI
jgi:hypothetical protein